jgi:hypothetical protein
MKRVLVIFFAVSLVLAPYAFQVSAKASPSGRPPVEQPLVREGDFAATLANALNLATSKDEAAAENALASISIAPRNGWISDYPMTPDIIAEVRESTARAASSGSLKMAEADATGIVDRVSQDMKLPIMVAGEQREQGGSYEQYGPAEQYGYSEQYGAGERYGSSEQYAYGESSSSSSSSEYAVPQPPPPDQGLYGEQPGYIDNYYGEYGPPIVSYYPPPWDYYWLYDWVPFPFWWGGFGFGGFFVLGDFDAYHHGYHYSNHYRGSNGSFSRVDPATRASGTTTSSHLAGAGSAGHGARLNSPTAREAARALANRGTGTRTGNTAGTSSGSNRLSAGNRVGTSGGSRSANSVNRSPSFSGRSAGSAPSMHASNGSGFRGASGGFRGGGYGGGGYGGGGFHGGGGFGGGHGGGGGGHR